MVDVQSGPIHEFSCLGIMQKLNAQPSVEISEFLSNKLWRNAKSPVNPYNPLRIEPKG
jgi:hypothetical protein